MRESKRKVMPEILERYSTRCFRDEMPSRAEILDILEAARFAPSCFNEQPWRFVIGWRGNRLHQIIYGQLTEKNQVWNLHTPILLVLIANREFEHNGKENFWATFDLGAAWGFLQLQAQRLGIATHAMGGFRRDALHHALSLSEKEVPVAVVALGYYGDPAGLPADLRERDKPNDRREVEASILAE